MATAETKNVHETLMESFEEVSNEEAELDTKAENERSEEIEESEVEKSVNRDEKGRFVAKNKDTENVETVEEVDDSEEETVSESDDEDDAEEEETAEEEEVPEEFGPLEPPVKWSLEEQNLFRKQPKEVQEWALGRDKKIESEYTKKTQELADKRKQYGAIEEVIGPRLQNLSIQGLSPSQYLSQLVSVSDYAAKDPVNFIKWFSQEKGVDLSKLSSSSEDSDDIYTEKDFQDPRYEQLTKTVSELQSKLSQQTEHITKAQETEIYNSINNFKNEVNEAGELKHPYFDEVRSTMGVLFQSGQVNDFESAYDMAVYANPETRAKLQAAQNASAVRKAQEERRAKATAAKRAGSSITGTPAGSTSSTPAKSVREELERAMSRAS